MIKIEEEMALEVRDFYSDKETNEELNKCSDDTDGLDSYMVDITFTETKADRLYNKLIRQKAMAIMGQENCNTHNYSIIMEDYSDMTLKQLENRDREEQLMEINELYRVIKEEL